MVLFFLWKDSRQSIVMMIRIIIVHEENMVPTSLFYTPVENTTVIWLCYFLTIHI